eukprot:2878663-Rhodomonas_salina.2
MVLREGLCRAAIDGSLWRDLRGVSRSRLPRFADVRLHWSSEKNIDAATIDKILEAAKVKVTGFYPCMFEKALKGADVAGLLKSAITVGGGGGGGGGGGAAPAAAAGGENPYSFTFAASLRCPGCLSCLRVAAGFCIKESTGQWFSQACAGRWRGSVLFVLHLGVCFHDFWHVAIATNSHAIRGAGAAPAAAAKAPEPEEEAEEDMGFSLFD